MPIKLMKRFGPADCQANSDHVFVFGDNMGMNKFGEIETRTGTGGQACIRYEKNALGIATKLAPFNEDWAFFSDTDKNIALAKSEFETKFNLLQIQLYNKNVVVWPEDGIGTGLAQLPERAPQIWAMLDKYRAELFAYGVEGN